MKAFAIVAAVLVLSSLAYAESYVTMLEGACPDPNACVRAAGIDSYITNGNYDSNNLLAQNAIKSLGGQVRYGYGSNDVTFLPEGGISGLTDCSGFTKALVKQAYGVALPRTAAEQCDSRFSDKVEIPQPGDLLCWKGTNPAKPPGTVTHVGIFLQATRSVNGIPCGKFIAASSSAGIVKQSNNCDGSLGVAGGHFSGYRRVRRTAAPTYA